MNASRVSTCTVKVEVYLQGASETWKGAGKENSGTEKEIGDLDGRA
jgi:hypothetical protein